jgi:hypothetical protein
MRPTSKSGHRGAKLTPKPNSTLALRTSLDARLGARRSAFYLLPDTSSVRRPKGTIICDSTYRSCWRREPWSNFPQPGNLRKRCPAGRPLLLYFTDTILNFSGIFQPAPDRNIVDASSNARRNWRSRKLSSETPCAPPADFPTAWPVLCSSPAVCRANENRTPERRAEPSRFLASAGNSIVQLAAESTLRNCDLFV